ncbi:hypothetical protein D3C87_1704950 [compost metagenome]
MVLIQRHRREALRGDPDELRGAGIGGLVAQGDAQVVGRLGAAQAVRAGGERERHLLGGAGLQEGLEDDVGRPGRPPHAEELALDLAQARAGTEAQLDRLTEVGVDADVAGIAVGTSVELREGGDALARAAAGGTQQVPCEFE